MHNRGLVISELNTHVVRRNQYYSPLKRQAFGQFWALFEIDILEKSRKIWAHPGHRDFPTFSALYFARDDTVGHISIRRIPTVTILNSGLKQ